MGSRYRLEALLGVGSFGVVLRALDQINDSPVALKILRVWDASAQRRFKREFRICAGLTHPNLVRLFELDRDPQCWMLAMEYVAGCGLDRIEWPNELPLGDTHTLDPECETIDRTAEGETLAPPIEPTAVAGAGGTIGATAVATDLDAAIERLSMRVAATTMASAGRDHAERERQELRRVVAAFGGIAAPVQVAANPLECLAQVVSGVRAIHHAGLVHGDLKPVNVLVRADGVVKILDFGLAHAIRPSQGDVRRVAGTARYMAPELSESGLASPASDWYAIGVTAVEMLCGWEAWMAQADRRASAAPASSRAQRLQDAARSLLEDDPRLRLPGSTVDALVDLLDPAPIRRTLASEGLEVLLHESADEVSSLPRPGLPRMGLVGRGSDMSTDEHSIVEMSALSSTVSAPPADSLAGPSLDLGLASVASADGLVGRRPELVRLSEIWEGRGETNTRVLVLSGPSGIGKSAVCRTFAGQRARAGDLVIRVTCLDQDRVPFAAFDGFVESVADEIEAHADLRTRVRNLPEWSIVSAGFPALRGLGPGLGPAVAAEAGDRPSPAALAALAGVLRVLVADRSLVLELEDVQWADSASAVLFARISSHVGPERSFVIASARQDDRGRLDFVAELERAAALEGVDLEVEGWTLGPLDSAASERLLLDRLDLARTRGLDGAVSRAAALAGGEPWALELWSVELREAWIAGRSPASSLRELVDRRVEGLGTTARAILDYLAVASGGLTSRQLRQLVGDEGDFDATLADLQMLRLVERRARAEKAVYSCLHARIASLLQASLHARDTSGAVHRRLARLFLDGGGAGVARGVRHLQLSGARDQAGAIATQRARLARDHGQFEAAAHLFELASESANDEADRLNSVLAQVRCLVSAGRLTAAGRVAAQGLGRDVSSESLLAARDGVATRRAELALLRVKCVLPTEGGDAVAAETRVLVDHSGLPWPSTPTRALFGFLGNAAFSSARGWWRKTPTPGETPSELAWSDRVCVGMGVALAASDFPRAAYFHALSLRRLGRESPPADVARALCGVAYPLAVLRMRMLVPGLRRWMHRVARSNRSRDVLAPTLFGEALVAYHRLELERAENLARRAIVHYRGAGEDLRIERYYVEALVSQIHAMAGDIPALHAHACAMDFDARAMDDPAVARWGRFHRGRVALAHDELVAARAHLRSAEVGVRSDVFHIENMGVMDLGIQVELYAGRPLAALARLRRAWPRLVASGLALSMIVATDVWWRRAAVFLAVAHASRGRDRDRLACRRAVREARRAARKLESLPASLPRARGLCIKACVAMQAGDRDRAMQLLERARDEFRASGVRLWRAIVETCLAGLRQDVAARLRHEREVIELGVQDPDRFVHAHLAGLLPGRAGPRVPRRSTPVPVELDSLRGSDRADDT